MQFRKIEPGQGPYTNDNIGGWRVAPISADDVWYIISRALGGAVGRRPVGFRKLVERYAAEGLDLALLNDAIKAVPPVRGRDVLTHMGLVFERATPRRQQAPVHDLTQGGRHEPQG